MNAGRLVSERSDTCISWRLDLSVRVSEYVLQFAATTKSYPLWKTHAS